MAPPSLTAFCFYLFSTIDSDVAHIFFDNLERGTGLTEDDPVYVLRERLLKEKQIRTSRVRPHYLAAWNAFRQGKKIKLLIWRAETEPFPEI